MPAAGTMYLTTSTGYPYTYHNGMAYFHPPEVTSVPPSWPVRNFHFRKVSTKYVSRLVFILMYLINFSYLCIVCVSQWVWMSEYHCQELVLCFHHIGPGSLYPLNRLFSPDSDMVKAETNTNIVMPLLPKFNKH